MSKISSLAPFSEPISPSDITVLVDVSDQSMAFNGTNKKVTVGALKETVAGDKVTNLGGVSNIIRLTQAAYDGLSEVDSQTLYIIID